MIGQKIGAGKFREAKELERTLTNFATAVNFIELAVFYVLCDHFLIIFTT